MDQWKSLVENPVYLLAAGALVLLILLLVIGRRRRSAKRAGAGAGRPDGLWRIVEGYSQTHPHFFKILETFRASHSVDQLCRDREIMEAFQRLGKIRPKGPETAGSPLSLAAATAPERSSEAAMLTILKGIFGHAEYARDLPPEVHRELEQFLDSLTE